MKKKKNNKPKKGHVTLVQYLPRPGEPLPEPPTPKPKKSAPKRYIISSDNHKFIGRVFDLGGPVGLGFKSYQQMKSFPDCLYVFHIDQTLSSLIRRVESLNMVGSMLWTKHLPKNFSKFPISRYEWLTVIADVFLIRYISVLDCALLLTNDIFECGLPPHQCYLDKLRKTGVPTKIINIIKKAHSEQTSLRQERNSRIHHGFERTFTDDDDTFRMASTWEYRGHGLTGTDAFGRQINLQKFMHESIITLKYEFNSSLRLLQKQLFTLYGAIEKEFESRFSSKFCARNKIKPLPW